MMNYFEVSLRVPPAYTDILVALLSGLAYEGFVEEADRLLAYVPEESFDQQQLEELILKPCEALAGPLPYTVSLIAKQNWNAAWEENYAPVQVENRVLVRADFHPAPTEAFDHVITINPKMSFGTGHHETTRLMLLHQLELEHTGLGVLDVGTGTGILAIMAALRGATRVSAFDIEAWAAENAAENAALNNVADRVTVRQGTIETEPFAVYGGILANINRNILLREIGTYARFLAPGGWLLLSGFYVQDAPDVQAAAEAAGLHFHSLRTDGPWAAMRLEKQAGS